MKAKSEIPRVVGEHAFQPVQDLEILLGYWRMVSRSLKDSHYGIAREQLPEPYRRVTSHRYFEVLRGTTLCSILRIIPGVTLDSYPHQILNYLQVPQLDGNTFCDLGIYHLEREGDRHTVIRDCSVFSSSYAAANGHSGLFLQVPLSHVSHYQALGFIFAGLPFQPTGSAQTYVPMIQITAPELQVGPEPKPTLSIIDDK